MNHVCLLQKSASWLRLLGLAANDDDVIQFSARCDTVNMARMYETFLFVLLVPVSLAWSPVKRPLRRRGPLKARRCNIPSYRLVWASYLKQALKRVSDNTQLYQGTGCEHVVMESFSLCRVIHAVRYHFELGRMFLFCRSTGLIE